jgi:hypothetical protein
MVVVCAFTNHRKDVSVDLVSRKLPKREASTACTPWHVEARLLDFLNKTKISNLFLFSTHERDWSIGLEKPPNKIMRCFFFSFRQKFYYIFFFFSDSISLSPKHTREKKILLWPDHEASEWIRRKTNSYTESYNQQLNQPR